MDAKAKKIIGFMKKDGGQLDAFDIAIAVKMDEDIVEKLLNQLMQENLVAKKTDGQGKVFWSVAAPSQEAPKNTAKPTEEPSFSKPPIKEKTTRIITENEVLDLGDFSPKAAYKNETVNLGDFTPKAAPKSKNTDSADDDFEPKASKKVKKEKRVKEDADMDDFTPKAKAPLSPALEKHAVTIACSIVVLIIALILSGPSKDKVKTIVSQKTAEFVKTADFQPVKDNADKISSMEEKIKALEASISSMEAKITNLEARQQVTRPAAPPARTAPAARPAPAQQNRRR